MLLTDWGDYGHYQPLSLSWYPYLFGAATAWTGGQTNPEEFDAAFAATFLGRPAGDAAVASMRRLGKAVTGPSLGLRNRSNVAPALFDDPLNGRLAQADSQSVAEVHAAATEAIEAWSTLADPGLRQDYGFTARLLAFMASKLHATRQLQLHLRTLPEIAEGQKRGEWLSRLDAHVTALADSRARARALRAEFEICWLRHARRSEIGLTLKQFDALDRSYQDALAWVTEQRARFAAGQSVDDNMSTYRPQAVALLWEQAR